MSPPFRISSIILAVFCQLLSVHAADFGAALDTPGWTWTVTSPLNGTNTPLVMELPGARGGLVVKGAAGGSATLSTDVTLGKGMLLFRKSPSSQVPYVTFKGIRVEYRTVLQGNLVDGNWDTYAAYFAGGSGRLSIQVSADEVVDFIEFVPEPPTFAEALGIPEGSFSMVGDDWTIVQSSERAGYGLEVYVRKPGVEEWIDFPVTGPAEFSVDFRDYGSTPTMSVHLDGQMIWKPQHDGISECRATVSVGEGVHLVRIKAEKFADQPYAGKFGIYNPSIRMADDVKSGPLDRNGNWLSVGSWGLADINHDGEDALGPVFDRQSHVLRFPVEGPGYVSAWFHRPQDVYEGSIGWSSDYGVPVGRDNNSPGWRKETIWLPPGASTAGIRLLGSTPESRYPDHAVDRISLAPDALIPLEEALREPRVQWSSDSPAPWVGLLRGGTEKVAVSEANSSGSSVLSGQFMGPGTVTFRYKVVGGAATLTAGSQVLPIPSVLFYGPGTMSRRIESYGPVTLQWSHKPSHGSTCQWMEITDLVWAPEPAMPLAEALDTDADVSWSTSENPSFIGRPNTSGFGGGLAEISLDPREEAWLEAAVDGPGIFDFKQTLVGAELEVWVDGVRIDYAYQPRAYELRREPIWITGDGPHRIRLHFRAGGWAVNGGVDEVTWRKFTREEVAGWTGSSGAAFHSFTSGGKDDGSVVVLAAVPGTEQWIEREFAGPGLLEWDFNFGRGMSSAFLKVELDGSCVLPQSLGSWIRHRLAVPAGTHRIRWTSNSPPDSSTGKHYNELCRISEMTFTPGVTDVVSSLDLPSASWLMIGGAEPVFLTGSDSWDGVDAMSIGSNCSLYFCNLEPGVARLKGWSRRDSTDPWMIHEDIIDKGKSLRWLSSNRYFDSVELQVLPSVPLAQSLETDRELVSVNWVGIGIPSAAADGVDSAFSLLNAYNTSRLEMTVSGGAKVRFKWRIEGGGDFKLLINGHKLRVAPPTGDWSEVEFDVGGGNNTLQWLHSNPIDDGVLKMAWIDEMSVIPLPEWTLGGAAAGRADLDFNNSASSPTAPQWMALSYRESDGEAAAGVRCMYGESSLKTMVEGPAILTFSGRCFIPATAYPAGPVTSARVPKFTMEGGATEVYLQTELTVILDGAAVGNIPRRNDGLWSELSIPIPAGVHEVSWKLNERYGWSTGSTIFFKPATSEEGWVNGVGIKGGRQYFDEWVAGKPFPQGLKDPLADADGDGASNLLEYACGTDPLGVSSAPAKVCGDMSAEGGMFHFRVPYLSENVVGTIEMSSDLQTWTTYPASIARSAPASGLSPTAQSPAAVSGTCYFTATHQVLPIAITPANGKRYFRLKLRLPGDPVSQ